MYERLGEGSPAVLRQRRLVLDLSGMEENDGWVRVSDIPELSARLVREYGRKSQKTLSRDLNALEKMELIERQGRRVRANRRLILAFIPARASAGSEIP